MRAVSSIETVTVRGVRMAFEEAGAGQPLVCVHGNYASKRWFTEQLSAPPAGWRVIAPDLPNFGDSGALPGEVSIEAYASYLRRFLDALGLEQVVLLGHSLGGAVAQVFASGLPRRVNGLVLVASAPPNSLYGLPGGLPQGVKLPKLNLKGFKLPAGVKLPKINLPQVGKQSRAQLASSLRSTMPSRVPPYFDEIVDDAAKMNPKAAQENVRALMRYNTGNLKSFSAPTLVLRGARDTIITGAMARKTAQAFPNARLELWQDVGHSPQIEAPERFNTLLENFLLER